MMVGDYTPLESCFDHGTYCTSKNSYFTSIPGRTFGDPDSLCAYHFGTKYLLRHLDSTKHGTGKPESPEVAVFPVGEIDRECNSLNS